MDTSSVIDEALLLGTPRGALAAMLHAPPAGGPGVLFCNAFGEERKSSALTMVRLARAVAAAGFTVLRFDYWGCGDSEGEFVDADVETRLADIRCAADWLRGRVGGDVCLLGLRLGATLAAAAVQDIPGCAGLALVEPIPDGGAYLGGELRRKLVRQMMTAGSERSSRDEMMKDLERDDTLLDMDGFALRGAAYRQLTALGIRAGQIGFGDPVLVCQLHFNDRPKAELEAVCDAYREAGAEVEFVRLVLPPLWSRIDVTLAPELDAAVAEWFAAHFAA